MLTREQITEPLRWDIICFVPLMSFARKDVAITERGRWERHGSIATLPKDNDFAVMFPDNAADLMLIYPTATVEELHTLMLHISPVRIGAVAYPGGLPWGQLWQRIRRMGMTAGKTVGAVPKLGSWVPVRKKREIPKSVLSKMGSPETLRGTQAWHVLWVPNRIAALDVKYLALPPTAKQVMAGIDAWRVAAKKAALPFTITRRELADAMTNKFTEIGQTRFYRDGATLKRESFAEYGWAWFYRYRSMLIREGFLRAVK